MKKRLSFLLALALLLTSCGGSSDAAAATMRLRRTQGAVEVADGEDRPIQPKEDLGLYSGYGVDTRTDSYAWIDLDRVKLTKLDQDSEIQIQKDGRALEIEVVSGSLFFLVTEPLAEDETMEIRTSTMLVGIRGTCGWVSDGTAALLEGTVTVAAGEQDVTISAGEMAVLTEDGSLEVEPLTAASVPAFVRAELEEDSALAEAVKADSGLDVLAPVPDVMRLRDMYTYSRALSYTVDGELIAEITLFPDGQGRIGKSVTHDLFTGDGSVCGFIYNDSGTLAQWGPFTVTEDRPDHRKLVSISDDGSRLEEIEYYDEQGRSTKLEDCGSNYPTVIGSPIYDADGKLVRMDSYDADGGLNSYTLYEYD